MSAHNASDTTDYQEATTRVWPIFLQQGPRDENTTGISSFGMRCLRANATTKGSKAIGSVPGAAVTLKIYSWALVGVTCLVGGLFL